MSGSFSGILAATAGKNLNLDILKGDTIDATFLLKASTASTAAALNLTGYKARMQFRRGATSAVILDFSSTASPATITIGSTAGSLRIQQTAAITSALSTCEGFWDIKLVLVSSGKVNTISGGGFRVVETYTVP